MPLNTQYSRIFGQWPWKNPQGENQSEREFLLLCFRKKSDIHLQSKSTYLNPTSCLIFRANATSISVQYFSRKQRQNSNNLQPRFLCKENFLPSIFVHTLLEIRTVRTALNTAIQTSKTVPGNEVSNLEKRA